jgi:DNA-directed RNA polymerase specialized sigma subunit
MTQEEKSAIIGYYRSGATYEQIGMIMGISESYAKMLVADYLKINK